MMAVGNNSTVFFPNNRGPVSPTRSYSKVKPKSNGYQLQQSRNKLQLDLSPDQCAKSKQNQQTPGKAWNKGRHSPSKQVSPKTPPSSPVAINIPQGCNAPFYAGFFEPPSPGSLPKPPSHWMAVPTTMSTGLGPSELAYERLSYSVRTFLDVHV